MRLSTLRMKTCAALNGVVESTVPDKLAVPDSPACAADDPPANTPQAITTLPINPRISTDDLVILAFFMSVPPKERGQGVRPLVPIHIGTRGDEGSDPLSPCSTTAGRGSG